MPDVIHKVMSLISGDSEPGSDKDILLKQLAKEISQNKYAKFFRLRQSEADVPLGQFFYNTYKAIYPLQVFLKDPAKEAKIRQITLEAFLDKQVMDVIRRLSPDGIAERKQNVGADLPKILQEDLAALAAGFDNPKISAADKCYDMIAALKQFVFFDFCSLLKKFDPEMMEGDFLSQPKFTPVDVSLLTSELKNFLSVIPPLEGENDWKTVFEILKYCRDGSDVIPLAQWTNLLLGLREIKQSGILELITKLITGNPILEIKAYVPHENLSASYLEHKTMEIREIISGVAGSQRKAQINTMEQAVFGPLAVTRLNYYTPEKGRVLITKDLSGYTHALALNHLMTFIQEYISKEIHELCDILLIRGQWTNNAASRLMSEGFHTALEVTGEIEQLDDSLAESGSNGPRLRAALFRIDRDRAQARNINNIIDSIDSEALDIINRAVAALIVVGKHLKMLMEDSEKKHSELVMNWKELGLVSKTPLSQRISAAYKKINYFVQLMRLEISPIENG